ncbi:hypothetical protein GSI_11103 [Ganoderma sinense ZZ0214-1]|uniref:DUF659 domain-containing protein n=1 Tax=Ganoderma sinense ZZ0214-1 TaxID=1077348 RepID=A0A2G8RZ90_9APHY|nr:hypothetical protein GSI_11103 [Ganoderma sinense ZZ0214-1]
MNCYLDTKDVMSTSNLWCHAQKCWGKDVMEASLKVMNREEVREDIVKSILMTGTITTHFERKQGLITYRNQPHTHTETHAEIVKWVCKSVYPFTIMKDPGFQMLMKTGPPNYYILSPSTVARDVKAIFARTCTRIANVLQNFESKLNFATDAWMTPNHRVLVAVMVHFKWQGKGMCLPLDVVEVPVSHMGEELVSAFADMLYKFGIQKKAYGVTCDNATNNDTMIDMLADKIPGFNGQCAHVRCFLHVLNLITKALLKQFDARPKSKDKDPTDANQELEELLEGLNGYYAAFAGAAETDSDDDNPDDEVDPMGEMSEAQKAAFEAGVHPVKLILAKIQNFSFKVINSTTKLFPTWRTACTAHGLSERILPWDAVVNEMCAVKVHGLRQYEMSRREWRVARQLRAVLKHFKQATLFFSEGTPHLAKVIPAMDHLDKFLTSSARSRKLDHTIHVTCELAKTMLNTYYLHTDMSKTYQIAMVMHPRYKTNYFQQLKWPEEWQELALQLVKQEWCEEY